MHGQGSRLLGLHGVVVTNVGEAGERCPRCGRGPVMVKDRPVVAVRDLPIGGRATVLRWRKAPLPLRELWPNLHRDPSRAAVSSTRH